MGGDQRQIEMIKVFKERDFEVTIYGFTQIMQSFVDVRKISKMELNLSDYDVIILPTGSIKKNGELKSLFSSEKIFLEFENFNNIREDTYVFCGISTPTLQEYIRKTNKKVHCIFDKSDVSIYNSIPTVEGTLMMIIENTDFTIHNSNIYLFGFGRVGHTLARVLDGMGAKVSVVSNSESELARAFEMGLTQMKLAEVKASIREAQIIINTIPYKVVTKDIIDMMDLDVLIVDLASKPGGVNVESAKKRGVKVILAPGLPGLVAPKTAGRIYANAILRELEKCTELDLD